MRSLDKRPLIALALVVLVAHGLLLFNDGVYWDGWLVLTDIRAGNWESVRNWYLDAGLPIHYSELRVLALIPGALPVVANYASFFCLVLIAWFLYGIARECGLGKLHAIFVGAVAVTFPSFQADCQLVLSPYLFSLAAFVGGVWLAFRAEGTSAPRSWYMRSGAALLFLLGFGLSSLLVFYLGFLLAFLVVERSKPGIRLRLGLYIALPIGFWIAKSRLLPTTGLYSDYNSLRFTPDTWHLMWRSLENGILAQFTLIDGQLRYFNSINYILIAGIVAASVMWHRMRSSSDDGPSPIWILAFAAFLLACAVLPYALVGKFATAEGWDTRHAILVSIPFAIGLVALARLIPTETGKQAASFVLAAAVALFAGSSFNHSLWYIDRTAKDKAIVATLPSTSARNYSILWINDRFPVGPDPYRFYEWNSMFREAFNDQRHLGLVPGGPDVHGVMHFALHDPSHYGLAQFDPNGPQANLLVDPTAEYSPEGTAFAYIAHRFAGRESMDRFVRGLVQLQVTPREGLPLGRRDR